MINIKYIVDNFQINSDKFINIKGESYSASNQNKIKYYSFEKGNGSMPYAISGGISNLNNLKYDNN